MTGQIRKVGIVLMALFLALFVKLNLLQVVDAHKLANDPRNTRVAVRDFSRARGQILAADGTVLARSVPSGDAFERQRQYPEGDLFGQLTGFFSFTYGATGIERTYTGELAGRNLGIRNLKDVLVDRTVTGDVTLTVDKNLQAVARDQLGQRKGAIVALDPSTGAVLAFWSYPSFDPNALAGHDAKAVQAAYNAAVADTNKPLLARAYRETYPPGSTFKVVTAAAALERKPELATKVYPPLKELDLPRTNTNLPNFGGGTCGGTLPDLLRVSCNTGFAQMGLDLGPEALSAEATDFGFNERPPLDLPAPAAARFPEPKEFERDEPALAKSAIGQQNVRATPLQMAMVAGAVANGGTVMKPHVMAQVKDSDGNVVRTYEPGAWKQATTPEVAAQLRDLMLNVVARGTGTRAQFAGATVGGKTGTAQTVGDNAHAWFIGFAEGNNRKVAVAVIVESQPEVSEATGGRVAAPIAGAVMKAALGL
ncbi:MAG: penicillin-binding protein [Actinomycetota bacterium]|jgi:peptidoglycan glycosyltransferase|nr:penicillin-binding protein [Actinomycetota bacterium]